MKIINIVLITLGMRGQPIPGGPMMMPSHPGAYMPGPMGPPGQMISGPMMHTPSNIGQQQMMPAPNRVGPVGPQMMGIPGSATLPRTGPQNQIQGPPGQLPQGPPVQLPHGPPGQLPQGTQGPQNQIQGPPGSQTQIQVPSQGQQIQGPPISQGMPIPQGPQMAQISQQVGPQGPMVPGAPMSPTSSQMNIAVPPAQSQSMTAIPMQMPMMMAHPMPQQFVPPQGAPQPPGPTQVPAPPQEEQTAELISFD